MGQMTIHYSLLLVCVYVSLGNCGLEVAEKCDTCRELVKKFKEGLVRTAKSNFGGGNTQWEEKSLGSYAFSETRFLEITEKVCSSDGKEERKCHHLLEANEELLENWWFKHYAKGVDTDLREYLCVKKMSVCCPSGTFGPDCKECVGGRRNPCKGNGRCDGDGTRGGTGSCSCSPGYTGELCDNCVDGFYEESKDDKNSICSPCHQSCRLTCSESGPVGCDECRDGWQLTDDKGCVDLDECEDVSMCGTNEFCTNTDGSYQCTACHPACAKCIGASAKNCKECAAKYFQSGSDCLPCHVSCENSCADQSPATCDKCINGWKLSESGLCEDVDECITGEGNCDSDEYCVNTIGSYKCSTCHPSCQKCSGPGLDGCTQCRPGYERNELGQCVDVDECSLQASSCPGEHFTCLNTPGSFHCECEKGFVQQGEKCQLPSKGPPKAKSETGQKSTKNPKSNGKRTNDIPKMTPKKKSKRDTQRMTVSREDSILYAVSLVVFSIICAVLRHSILGQSLVTGGFWTYLYWLTSQMEQYVAKSAS